MYYKKTTKDSPTESDAKLVWHCIKRNYVNKILGVHIDGILTLYVLMNYVDYQMRSISRLIDKLTKIL